MASIKQVAEQTWRIVYANPNGDASNGLPEFELMTIAVLAQAFKIEYYQFNNEGEKRVPPSWIRVKEIKAEKGGNGIFGFCLPESPMQLPNDLGIYRVQPNSAQAGSYVKSSIGWTEILGTLMTGKRYYRLGNNIYFPDGLLGDSKDLLVMYVAAGSIDCEDEAIVPPDLVSVVIDGVMKKFFPTKSIIQDKEIDGSDNSKKQS